MKASFVAEARDAGTIVAERGHRLSVALSEDEPAAVRRAVNDLLEDLAAVSGCLPVRATKSDGARIVVGTAGVSPLADVAIADGVVDVTALRREDGSLQWEGFVIQLVGDTLFVVGADPRGTIFGIYELCEQVGVSPWRWWGDVPVRTRDHITVVADTHVADWPSVQYRGIFLNDEEELEKWAKAHTSDGTIGPATYERVFELLLRLKGNYIWPAMHVNAFNHDPANGRLAHEMGIVVGTSHCDMLLRSNEHEFGPWAARQDEPVVYDYSVPGRNRSKLLEYWRESVQLSRHYEVSWTLGMRGIHDSGFVTAAIDADDQLSPSQKHQARIDLLARVIADQRELLASTVPGVAHPSLQLFIPYKEVLALYDSGLDLPEDVTIVWADDNFGYVRRFPSEAERTRSGGHGLYYHSSYWSQPPRSYLATSSTPLALMRNELRKSWDRGIRKLWVNNIGGLKPLELETEFFLRCAWEAGRDDTTQDVAAFVETWVSRTFTPAVAKEAAGVYAAYYQINEQRKIEHLSARAFSQTSYGDEASRRLESFRSLFDQTNALLHTLPAEMREAFFQLFAIKIHMAYLVNGQFVHADRSALAYEQGKLAAADLHLAVSRRFDDCKRALIAYYNHKMSGGKWRYMFTPEEFPPPVIPLHPAARPALVVDEPGLGVVVWGTDVPSDEPVLTFDPFGATTKWIEVFSTGRRDLDVVVDAPGWIEVDPPAMTVREETRVRVRVRDPQSHAGSSGIVTVTRPGTSERVTVAVRVSPAVDVPSGFTGAVEADGYVSIDTALPDASSPGTVTTWEPVPLLGRYGNALMQARVLPNAAAPTTSGPAAGVLEYGVFLVTPGAHLLEVHRLPTLDATGGIRLKVGVDDGTELVVESRTTDSYTGSWTDAVLDNVERLVVRLPYLSAGAHTVRLQAMDEYVAVSKLVIYTSPLRPTNLGPDFSHHTGRPLQPTAVPDPGAFDPAVLDVVAREIYRTEPSELPLPDVVYAGPGFWDGDTTFRRNLVIPQDRLATPVPTTPDGSKNVLEVLGRGDVIEADGVIAFEAENALAQDHSAWLTPSLDDAPVLWTHTQAETGGRAGLAMHVDVRGRQWDDPLLAPGMHYALGVHSAGTYRVWTLVKFESRDDDSCFLALDGTAEPLDRQFSGGDMYSFGTQQIWFWSLMTTLDLKPGRRTFSILARKAGLRVDRVYLTLGDELPPTDARWEPSERR